MQCVVKTSDSQCYRKEAQGQIEAGYWWHPQAVARDRR